MQSAALPLINRHDYEQLPEGPPHYQVIEGDLVMSPSPNRSHQIVLGNIFYLLSRYLEKNPVGKIYLAPFDVFLSEINVYQPDLLFISNENEGIVTDHGIEGGPDIAIEILSPGTAKYDRGSKRKIYARTGVKELWLVDPETKRIEVFDLTKDVETPAGTYGSRANFGSPLLPGFKVSTARIFKI
jgi:Uma2 family endonuclease